MNLKKSKDDRMHTRSSNQPSIAISNRNERLDLSCPVTSSKRTRVGMRTSGASAENNYPNYVPDSYQEKRKPKKIVGKLSSLKPKSKLKRKGRRIVTKEGQSNFKRRLWTREEDEAITSLVKHYGVRKWTLISRKLQEKYHIYGRYGKQCRERYNSYSIDGIII